MKCQILFSRKNKKNIISLSSAEFAHSMVNVKCVLMHYTYLYLDLCCFLGMLRSICA